MTLYCVLLTLSVMMTLSCTTAQDGEEDCPDDAIPSDGSCSIFGNQYGDGQTFSDGSHSCTVYLCSNGVVTLERGGCEGNSKCYDSDSTFVEDCVTWNCSRSEVEGVAVFARSFVQLMCQDSQGNCYEYRRDYGPAKNLNCNCGIDIETKRVWYDCRLKEDYYL